MNRPFINAPWLLCGLLALSGCATKKLTNINSNDNAFWKKVERHKNTPSDISYKELWETYLKSSQPEDSGTKHNQYLETVAKLDAGEKTCSDIDWDSMVRLNYWSIKPHLSAASCKTELGDLVGAQYHQDFVATILEGVFSSGRGENYYDAYEVASWGDVEDILELAGMKSIDNTLELMAANQAVYYVVIAEDLETGMQQNIYFDNIRFMNAAMGFQGRFAHRGEALGVSIASTLANDNSHSAIAFGDISAANENYQQASEAYLKATILGSPVAYLRLASLCLLKQLPALSEEICLEYVGNAAEMGLAEAYIVLAGLYQEGIWVNKDIDLAKDFIEIAKQKLKPGYAYNLLGEMYTTGIFGEKNEYKSLRLFADAEALGAISTQYVEQFRLEVENNTEKAEDARNKLRELADSGDAMSQALTGAWLLLKSDKQSQQALIKESFEYITNSAQQGLPRAQYMLGTMYQYGIGTKKDVVNGLEWFKKAARSWHRSAQYEVAKDLKMSADKYKETISTLKNLKLDRQFFNVANADSAEQAFNTMRASAIQGLTKAIVEMGFYHRNGIGTEVDYKKAAFWYKIGVERESLNAMEHYADLLRNGYGVEVNTEAALTLLEKAAKKGSLWATNELGRMHQAGQGTAIDLQKARVWFLKAAEGNYQWSQYNLGQIYEIGNGVEVDLEKAMEWYQKASTQGHQQATQRLTILSGR